MSEVKGYCPMGCGAGTLALRPGGEVYCAALSCPDPDAVAKILDNPETEHVVTIREDSFSVKHPLRERVDDDLFDCRLFEELRDFGGPPAEPGVYRATRHAPDGYSESYRGDAIGWDLERIGDLE